ncbi:hypothetical protein DXF86_26380 [Citrobacter freundii]|nr:hypothetical protein DXF86_26380 [Citrobacter freundii]
MSWRSESPFTVGFRAYVGFWFHCSPNPSNDKARISGLCLLQNSSSSQFSFYRLTCGIHNLRVVVPGHATANDIVH